MPGLRQDITATLMEGGGAGGTALLAGGFPSPRPLFPTGLNTSYFGLD